MASLLADVAETLDQKAVPYAMIGAAALAAHGVARATLDLDLFTTDSDVLRADFWRRVKEHGGQIDVRLGDDEDPLAGVVRFSRDYSTLIDLVVGRHEWQRDLLARAHRIAFEGVDLPVVQPSDLVLLKLYAAGPQDRNDIEQLLRTGSRSDIIRQVEDEVHLLPPYAVELWRKLHANE